MWSELDPLGSPTRWSGQDANRATGAGEGRYELRPTLVDSARLANVTLVPIMMIEP